MCYALAVSNFVPHCTRVEFEGIRDRQVHEESALASIENLEDVLQHEALDMALHMLCEWYHPMAFFATVRTTIHTFRSTATLFVVIGYAGCTAGT